MCTDKFMVFISVLCGFDMHILWQFRIRWSMVIRVAADRLPFIREVDKHIRCGSFAYL